MYLLFARTIKQLVEHPMEDNKVVEAVLLPPVHDLWNLVQTIVTLLPGHPLGQTHVTISGTSQNVVKIIIKTSSDLCLLQDGVLLHHPINVTTLTNVSI